MYLFIIEIILTVYVWRRGWRWKSLIPMATVIVTCFLIGFFFTLFNISNYTKEFTAMTSLLGIIALVVMSRKKPA